MGKVIGLGGPFIKSPDPKALAAWYEKNLGINFKGQTYVDFPFANEDGQAKKGSNVLNFVKQDSKYFNPSTTNVMLNFVVDDLDSLMQSLKAAGIEFHGDPMDEDYGKFAWILDLDGNKVELWEPK